MEAVTASKSSKTIKIANAFYAISRSIHRLIKACCQFARDVSSTTASVTTSLKYRVTNIFEALPGLESPASRGVLGSLSWDRKRRKSRKNVPYLSERNFKFWEPHKMESPFLIKLRASTNGRSLLEGTFCQGRPLEMPEENLKISKYSRCNQQDDRNHKTHLIYSGLLHQNEMK